MGSFSAFVATGLRQMDTHHGLTDAPSGIADHAIVVVAIMVVAVTVYLCVRYLLSPGENEDSHIKRRILDDGTDLDGR